MMKKRKVAIIGVGHVGAHCAYALMLRGLVDELVLVDKNHQKAVSERQDLMDAVAYCPHRVNVTIADYDELGDCDIIVNSIGKIELLETHDRLTELNFTIKEVTDFIPKIMAGGFNGIFINITNPCDIITNQIAKLSGLPKGHVFGTGTGLDTSRLLSAISQRTGIDHKSITAYMMGEHGNCIMFPMSKISFSGKPLSELAKKDSKYQFDYEEMKNTVIQGAWLTYDGKKCTEYGICSTLARCVSAVFHDEKAIIPVSTQLCGEYGEENVFVGVPAIVGIDGVEEVIELELPEDELAKFKECCEGVRKNMTMNDLVIR